MSTPPAALDEARVIRGLIVEAGATRSQVASALHISTETLRRRLHKPGSFSLGEIDVVATALGTTAEEILRRARRAA